jgi:hypothetical protein
VVIVIAAILHLHFAAHLNRGRTPEFASDHDERVLQHSARLEVLQ